MSGRVLSLAVTAAAVLFTAAAPSQRGTIRGVVFFGDGFVSGVPVTIDDKTTATDRFGHFELDDVAVGRHRVCAGGRGWKRTCTDVATTPAEDSSFVELRVVPEGSWIRGIVRDAEGVKKHGTLVVRRGDAVVATVPVDAYGEFVVPDVPPGALSLEATAGGATATLPLAADAPRDGIVIQTPAASPRSEPLEAAAAGAPCNRFTTVQSCPAPCNTGQFLSRKENTEAKALEYYRKLDPNGRRKTLADWIRVARHEELAQPVRASYANANDLGFGRDMYMVKTRWGVFAWVSNFAAECRLQDPRNADLAAKGDPKDIIATVCMELSSENYHGPGTDPRVLQEPKIVKFLVFDHDGKLVPAALLDTFQPGYVPGLCLNCHGGNSFRTRLDLEANFLPFDLETFHYPGGAAPDYRAFRKLNDLVLETLSPDAAAIRQLIKGWYPDDRIEPRLDWRPPGWEGTEKLYDRLVARTCRTCHVAFELNQFTSYAGFRNARETIIGNVDRGAMPHAQITYMNFHGRNDLWPDATALQTYQCFRNNARDADLRACLQRVP